MAFARARSGLAVWSRIKDSVSDILMLCPGGNGTVGETTMWKLFINPALGLAFLLGACSGGNAPEIATGRGSQT